MAWAIVRRVSLLPAPTTSGALRAQRAAAHSMMALRSLSVIVAGSPVVPRATMASTPLSSCQSISASSASKSIRFPLNGVTSAVPQP